MCRPITSPTSPRSWSKWRMCTGVIVMIATIVIWVSTMIVAPTYAPGPAG